MEIKRDFENSGMLFSACLCSLESERKQGKKSQLEAWKTVTLHSESCNILTTKRNKRGESEEGGQRQEGREGREAGIKEMGIKLGKKRSSTVLECYFYTNHTHRAKDNHCFAQNTQTKEEHSSTHSRL